MADENSTDAVVIGAGLAGLSAALHLQKAWEKTGKRVLVLERRSAPGGLAGTFERGGHTFVYGCNDFGGGLEQAMIALGVDVRFLRPKMQFHFGDRRVVLPPDARTLLHLLRRVVPAVRAYLGVRKGGVVTLGELIDRHIHDPVLRDIACILATGVMRSPDDLPLADIAKDFAKDLAYGYDKAVTPVGGPGVLARKMADRLVALGGEIRLGCAAGEVTREGSFHRVATPGGSVLARAVISSEGRWRDYPGEMKSGFEVALVVFALARPFAYPEGFHTVGWFSPDVPAQLRRLDRGEANEAFSFHLFCSDLPAQPDGFTVSGFVPMPRGVRALGVAAKTDILRFVTNKAERMMPGFARHIRYQDILAPEEYEALFGLRPVPSPRIAPPGFEKPSVHDAERDMFFVGSSVGPPGEHAGAALLSGKWAAQEVIAKVG